MLSSYIIYDKFKENDNKNEYNIEDEKITLVDNISLDYVDIYLTSDGISYIAPINEEKINNLKIGDNLKERLNTLYTRAFYYDIFINNYKLKGFIVKLDSKIQKIKKVELEENIYIIFIKENGTVGLFNYDEYYNLLYTKVEDNYKNLKNVLDIKENKIIYLDGSKETFNL